LLIVAALPMAANAAAPNDPFFVSGFVWDNVNEIGIGGATVELYYEVSTWSKESLFSERTVTREWVLKDTCVSNEHGVYQVGASGAIGRYKIVVTAPEEVLLGDQTLVYTADNTVCYNPDGPQDDAPITLPEDPELLPNQSAWVFGRYGTEEDGIKQVEQAEWWEAGDYNFNYVADTTLTPPDDCEVVDMLSIVGTVAFQPDPLVEGIPAAGVQVEVERGWLSADPGGWWTVPGFDCRPFVDKVVQVRAKVTSVKGTYAFMLPTTKSEGNEYYVYRVIVDGTASDWFTPAVPGGATDLMVWLDYETWAGAFMDMAADACDACLDPCSLVAPLPEE